MKNCMNFVINSESIRMELHVYLIESHTKYERLEIPESHSAI